MSQRLLLVEQSATMRSVMEQHASSLGFAVHACGSYEQASQSLEQQFQQFGDGYSGLIFGWPTESQDDAQVFARQLETSAHKDLPVVVMSTDMRAEARAWTAARRNTAMLGWKEYQELEESFGKLTDITPALTNGASAARPVTANNSDIHLLVVDDSATIRYSMRDLFEAHGYTVTLAATREEAMRDASNDSIDIAVLDYYLKETTGDLLCSELLASEHTGNIVCTVLTGTYSDHIIKRSLRAGAVECMFKNESSELLLSRINAISQFVRQQRQLQIEQQLLEDVLEHIAGSVILISGEQKIVYVNTPALSELGISEKSALLGQSSATLLEEGGPRANGQDVHSASWKLPEGGVIEVDYQHSLMANGGYSLLRFARRTGPVANAEMVTLHRATAAQSTVHDTIAHFSLAPVTEPFLTQMQLYLENANKQESTAAAPAAKGDTLVSLLLLDVFMRRSEDSALIPIFADEPAAGKVWATLNAIIASDSHVVALGENRYGFLLRHTEESQAYVLTRKIMQRCLETPHVVDSNEDSMYTIACTGSLLGLTKNNAQSMNVLIRHAFNGLELVNSREPNQAILLDVRRLLRAYPAS